MRAIRTRIVQRHRYVCWWLVFCSFSVLLFLVVVYGDCGCRLRLQFRRLRLAISICFQFEVFCTRRVVVRCGRINRPYIFSSLIVARVRPLGLYLTSRCGCPFSFYLHRKISIYRIFCPAHSSLRKSSLTEHLHAAFV